MSAAAPIVPPFTLETATRKVQMAEDAWNSRDPERVALSYSLDSEWRNRTEFPRGREEIKAFLRRKWEKELDYRLKKHFGDFVIIASPSALNTNGTMRAANGTGPMERSSGSSTRTA